TTMEAPASASDLAMANPKPPSSATPATSARFPRRSMASMARTIDRARAAVKARPLFVGVAVAGPGQPLERVERLVARLPADVCLVARQHTVELAHPRQRALDGPELLAHLGVLLTRQRRRRFDRLQRRVGEVAHREQRPRQLLQRGRLVLLLD